MKEQHNRTPREIVKELDRYIIGQDAAKKAIAVALRNRYRRQKLDADMQKEVTPKNIRLRKRYLDPHERKRQSRAD